MSIPQLRFQGASGLVPQEQVNSADAFVPHPATILIVKQNRALQQIFVVTINRSADMAVGVGPLTRLDIDPGADQTYRRAPVVNLNQSALRLVIENLSMSKARQSAELDQQCSRFSRIRDVVPHLSRFQIHIAIGQACW